MSWVTMHEPGSNSVLYWTENSKQKNKAEGILTTYKFYNYTSGYIHHCTIKNLKVEFSFFPNNLSIGFYSFFIKIKLSQPKRSIDFHYLFVYFVVATVQY